MSKTLRRTVAAAVLALTSTLAVAMITPSTARAADVAFADEFNGAAGSAPNGAYWNHEVGAGGWGNDEKQTYTSSRQNSRLDGDGNLLIEARRDGDTWTSARINTKDKFEFTYGTINARIAMPKGQGLHTGWWMLGHDIWEAGFPDAGEIDMAEHINSSDFVHIGIHGPTGEGGFGSLDLGSVRDVVPDGIPLPTGLNGQYSRGSDITGIDPSAFHTYGVRKTATAITFLFDGAAYFTVNRSELTAGEQWVYNKPMYPILNLAVGGTWPGATNSSTPNPGTVKVDWIRYTP
ncbi:glycoside hydrolase family 16 protein [Gordonia sp. ABSL11-1]|uniref:glycoside hydrolase family 16 protein n=1 Tax=Gordonia sp. ABSL11-1 TaxID=3053924 RepID=UPI0025748D61|nr:glycoside hydrolase family 16 protein [Gordonia sp. ABSL11-1]MDL9947032.1 glycoside hydrolase family 16 protein [Gordonia sp. ABSL11-1]